MNRRTQIISLFATLLLHMALVVILWSYSIDNSCLSQKKALSIELYGRPDKPYGSEEMNRRKESAEVSKLVKTQQKKYLSTVKDEHQITQTIDSLPDTNKLLLKSEGGLTSSTNLDTAGGMEFGYGSGQFAELPSFAGGGIDRFREWIMYNVRSSDLVAQKKISGTILITFVVNIDGEVTDVKVQKGINTQIDEEAVRIFKSSPRWKPGKQQGQPVKVVYKLPLTFSM
jgi:TonB family protein